MNGFTLRVSNSYLFHFNFPSQGGGGGRDQGEVGLSALKGNNWLL